MTTYEAALKYISLGFAVLPIHSIRDGKCTCGNSECQSPGKHPCMHKGVYNATKIPEVAANMFQKAFPQANIAIATGAVSGMLAVDVDIKNNGHITLEDLIQQNGQLPETIKDISGGGGNHYYFRTYGQKIANHTDLLPGIDIRGDGGYIVVAPSIHHSGRSYDWSSGHAPWECEIAEAPEWLRELIAKGRDKKRRQKAIQDLDSGRIPEGGRNSYLLSEAGRLRRTGLDSESIEAMLQALNEAKCNPPLSEHEVSSIADSIDRYAPTFPLTDLGNAERLIYHYGHLLKYLPASKRWYYWSGSRWTPDACMFVENRAKEVIRWMAEEAKAAETQLMSEELWKWAKKSEALVKIRAAIDAAKFDPTVVAFEEDFDADIWLLNVQNGILDLRTGKLEKHHPGKLMSKEAPVRFDPSAQCPTWIATVSRCLDYNPDLILYFQKVLGYFLTGSTSEQSVFLAYGTGANGKSTIINLMFSVLGPYAIQVPIETLMVKQSTGIPNDIARLKGRRMASASEVEDGQRLAESLIKQMTGNDPLTARFLYGEYFDFYPQFKIMILTNHKPNIKGTDEGIWRRIKLLPFNVTIPLEMRDKELPQKLELEKSGILNWLIEGCLLWQKEGLTMPLVMQNALEIYKTEVDIIGNFLDDCCIINDSARESGVILFETYKQWCDFCGEKPSALKAFYRRLREKGYETTKGASNGSRVFQGLQLKPTIEGFENSRNFLAIRD